MTSWNNSLDWLESVIETTEDLYVNPEKASRRCNVCFLVRDQIRGLEVREKPNKKLSFISNTITNDEIWIHVYVLLA